MHNLVSVVLPVRNGASYLQAAIGSVVRQSHSHLELIVVDDGSTDESAVIAERFSSADPRVSVLRLPPTGLVHALNAGIARARGEYVARIDSDDVAHPERLKRQVAYLQAHPHCVVVGSAIEVIDADDQSLGTRYFAEEHEEIVRELLLGTFAISHPTVLMRRDVLVAAGGYDPSMYPSEDFALWLTLSDAGRLANLREPLLRYRRHEQAVSVRNRPLHHALTTRITNAARLARGLAPISNATTWSPHDQAAEYHFDCARFAMTGGSRRDAVRHLLATIRLAPLWREPYAALLACALPRRVLLAALAFRARLRAPMQKGDGALTEGCAKPAPLETSSR